MSPLDLALTRDAKASRTPSGGVRMLIDTSGIGGIEKHVAVLVGALRRRGMNASVLRWADYGANPWLDQLDAAGIPHAVVSGGALGLARRIAAEDVALLHTHGYKAGVIGRLIARLCGIPVVSTFHAGETGRFPVNLYQKLDEWTGVLGRRISVSEKIAERLPYASRTIANFIETPDAPSEAELPATVGFVGRLSYEKGPDLFCEAAARCEGMARFVVYGDGPMRGELEARYGGAVAFRGMVADMAAAWPQIGLLLMPSRAEGLPMAALEALAAGAPVAASRVGALPEVIRPGVNGYLFEPGGVDAMCACVRDWAETRAARSGEWRRATWNSVREKFGVEAGLVRTLEVYREAGFTPPPAR